MNDGREMMEGERVREPVGEYVGRGERPAESLMVMETEGERVAVKELRVRTTSVLMDEGT